VCLVTTGSLSAVERQLDVVLPSIRHQPDAASRREDRERIASLRSTLAICFTTGMAMRLRNVAYSRAASSVRTRRSAAESWARSIVSTTRRLMSEISWNASRSDNSTCYRRARAAPRRRYTDRFGFAFASRTCANPAGEFLMGAVDAAADERPVHRVYVSEFFMGRFPITTTNTRVRPATGIRRRRFRGCRSRLRRTRRRFQRACDAASGTVRIRRRVTARIGRIVSFDDALASCRWLSESTERVVRLPTEAE
jgi:hypothetical protein